jgi:mycothiol synthase
VQQWGADRVEELATLVASAAPQEDLTADELLTACFEQAGVVLASTAGDAAVAVGLGPASDDALVATVRLLVVDPGRRRLGLGRGLLDAAELWARSNRADRLEIGGSAPFALWPGVEPRSGLARIAAHHGFEPGATVHSFALAVDFRSSPPADVVVRRAVLDDDVAAVVLHVAGTSPRQTDEVARALEHGTCHVACDAGEAGQVVGFGCHSVTRAASVGPLVVRPDARRRGVGLALLGQICRDLMIAEFRAATIDRVIQDDVVAVLDAAGAQSTGTRRAMVKQLRS